MPGLVPQDRRQLGLAFQVDEKPPVDHDEATGEREGVGDRGVEHPVAVVEIRPVGYAGDPHTHGLDVLLQLPVAVEAALLLDCGGIGLRPRATSCSSEKETRAS